MIGYIVTFRFPTNPLHAAALRCNHSKIGAFVTEDVGRHCAFMECPNYREKCPLHAIVRTGDECSRAKKTGSCPFSSNCTDATGEHHSLILWAHDLGEVTRMAEGYLIPGSQVTRIESAE